MKFGLFAHSSYSLWPHYEQLKRHGDCVWAVNNRHLLKELQARPGVSTRFCDNPTGLPLPWTITRCINRLYRVAGKDPARIFLQKLVSTVAPDVWLSDTSTVMTKLLVDAPRVQAFHSLPFKAYVFHPAAPEYDLILVPSSYYRDEFVRRYPGLDARRLRVVGWPRADIFHAPPFSREATLDRFGLDPARRTVLFAPTWGLFPPDRFFPESWGDPYRVFESLCRDLAEAEVNLIVKLHHFSIRLIRDARLRAIAERHGAVWFNSVNKHYMEDPRELLYATDLLMSDVSGTVTDFLPLDRPIVFIDIDDPALWSAADLLREDRAGSCVSDPRGLLRAIMENLEHPALFADARRRLREKVFDNLDGNAAERACAAVLEFCQERQVTR